MNTSTAQRAGIPGRIDWLVHHVWYGNARNLARAADMAEGSLSSLRSGRSQLGAKRGARIAEVSGVSLLWLMKGIGEPPTSPRKDWFVTHGGHRLFVTEPNPAGICIDDIAHGLSNICRFGGQAREFYSVAQHSILVSRHVSPELALVGLLHDATEAYLGDVIRPLKLELGASYRVLEDRWARAIGERFGVTLEPMPAEIHQVDRRALLTERRDVLTPSAYAWVEDRQEVALLPERVCPSSPEVAKTLFLARFRELV